MPTFDVVLHTNAGIFRDGAQTLLALFPPVEDRIEMSQGLWLGRQEGLKCNTSLTDSNRSTRTTASWFPAQF
jgi:hypothetical protein